jgi:Ca2+-binding RTX toxin-like protein
MCVGLVATIVGTEGDDNLLGTDGPDVIWSGPGFDTVRAGDGDDVVCGDSEADELWGDDGADALHGGQGADRLAGGPGNDDLSGGTSDEHIGDLVIVQTIAGGPIDMDVNVNMPAGTVTGQGNDTLVQIESIWVKTSGFTTALAAPSTSGITTGDGGSLVDTGTVGGHGRPAIGGGEGDDHFIISRPVRYATGGCGMDVYDITHATGTTTIQPLVGSPPSIGAVCGYEINGGPAPERILLYFDEPTTGPKLVNTGGGDDFVSVQAWPRIDAGTVNTGSGNDTLFLSSRADAGKDGMVDVRLGPGRDDVRGTDLRTSGEPLLPMWRNDQSVIRGGPGRDRIIGTLSNDLIDLGTATLTSPPLFRSLEDALGKRGRDVIRGNGANNRLTGGHGADVLIGKAGHDQLIGGPDRPDKAYGGPGVDSCRAERRSHCETR